MSKKHKAKKDEPKLSKKAAAKAAAERSAEVERADKKAAKKAAAASEKSNAKAAKKAAKGKSSVPEPVRDEPRHPHMDHLDRVGELSAIVNDPEAKKSARKAAQAELDTLRAEGQARIDAADAAKGTAADAAPVDIDAEVAARVAKKRAEMGDAPAPLAGLGAARASDAKDGESEVEYQQRKLKGKKKPTPPVAVDDTPVALDVAEANAAAEESANRGDAKIEAAFDAGTLPDSVHEVVAPTGAVPVAEEFGMPSEAKLFEDRTNGNGQYLVKRPADGKEVGYTRATTYIATNEDTTMLTQWKMRILLEGIAAADEQAALSSDRSITSPIVTVRDLVHQRDHAIAKARKADRKGKLVPGQLATMTDGAWSDFKKAMNALADEVFDIGGGHEKAQKGTDIHALCDLAEAEGIAAVEQKLQDGEITPADLADVEAYLAALQALGMKTIERELVVVNDALKVGGRLDRIYLAKIPEIRNAKGEIIFKGDTRARRYVGDIKTGRVDLSAGKIAQQIRLYAESDAYNEETGERSSHGANRTHGLLIHVPAGTATAHVHLVDLGVGGVGNKLSGEVRQFRNTGKRAYDTKIDLLQVVAEANDAAAADVGAGE